MPTISTSKYEDYLLYKKLFEIILKNKPNVFQEQFSELFYKEDYKKLLNSFGISAYEV